MFAFAQRLNDAVRAVMIGYEENIIHQRLLNEFLDRLILELQFEVKSSRPEDYTKAFEAAEHFELLLAEKRPNFQNNQFVELAEKVEALAIQNGNNFRRKNLGILCQLAETAHHNVRCTQIIIMKVIYADIIKLSIIAEIIGKVLIHARIIKITLEMFMREIQIGTTGTTNHLIIQTKLAEITGEVPEITTAVLPLEE